MSYNLWLKFKKDKNKILNVKKQLSEEQSDGSRKVTIDDILLGLFVDNQYEEKIDIYDVNKCVLIDFPLIEQCNVIQRYMIPYTYYHNTQDNNLPYDINKLIYHLWPIYMTNTYSKHNKAYPHNIIYEVLYTIKQKLKAMKHLDMMEKEDISYKYTYLNFELLGFIPLIGSCSDQVLMNAAKGNYADAQEYLVFALHQKDPHIFHTNLKKILIHWDKYQSNIESYDQGTGMRSEVQQLINKYKKAGYNLLLDNDLPFLKEHYE